MLVFVKYIELSFNALWIINLLKTRVFFSSLVELQLKLIIWMRGWKEKNGRK